MLTHDLYPAERGSTNKHNPYVDMFDAFLKQLNPQINRNSLSHLSVSENLDEIPCRIIGLTLVLTLPYATHMFAYAVHLEQEGLTQTLRDACLAQNAADTITRAYALHTLYNGHLLHLIFGYGC